MQPLDQAEHQPSVALHLQTSGKSKTLSHRWNNQRRSKLEGSREVSRDISASHPVIAAIPWHRFPNDADLPTVDHLHSMDQKTSFIDSKTTSNVKSILSTLNEELCAQELKPDWMPTKGLAAITNICLILHLIHCHDLLLEFLEHEITDVDLNLSKSKLRSILKDDRAVGAFHKAQYKVTLRDLENGWAEYKENELLPLRTIRNLGSGGFATVDCVEHVLNGQELAHKVFSLTPKFESRLQQSFLAEIQSLKKLTGHRHIVEYLGAYRRPNSLGLLLRPVAACDLYKFLRNPRTYDFGDKQEILYHAFGCLASALAYMHAQQIRHKDIKAHNVLLERTSSGTNLLFTDFGIAKDFSEIAKSTTEGPGLNRTLRYSAPEVARGQARGRRSDVYSLGCLFLEVLTVISGYTLEEFDEWVGGDGVFHESQIETMSWMAKLAKEGDEGTALIAKWTASMLRKIPGTRPQAQKLVDDIAREAKSQKDLWKRLFCDLCTNEMRVQGKISWTQTGEDMIIQVEDSEYETDDDDESQKSRTSLTRRSKVNAPHQSVESEVYGTATGGFANQGQERTYIDITAIPRLRSGNLFSVVQAYVSLVDCLRCYNTCANITSLWQSSNFLRRRLDFEMLRLLNWSFVVGLSRGGPLQPPSLESPHKLKAMISNFNQQQVVFEHCLREQNDPTAFLHQHHTLHEVNSERQIPAISRLLLTSMISSIIVKPAGPEVPIALAELSPGLVDVQALKELEEHNDHLCDLLEPNTMELLLEKAAETNLELLQMCETYGEIVDLVHAVWPPGLPSPESTQDAIIWPLPDHAANSVEYGQQGLKTRQAVARFARFKAINAMIAKPQDKLTVYIDQKHPESNNIHIIAKPGIELPRESIVMMEEEDYDQALPEAVPGLCRIKGRGTRPIWIEWKLYEPTSFASSTPHPLVSERIRSLAILLNDSEKPRDLCTPHCLGYFRDVDKATAEDHWRIGLVFEVPSHVRGGNGSLEPVTLQKTIRSQVGVPVSARLQLALKLSTSLLYLHSVNWLHKGLRSQSILFFEDSQRHVNLQDPFISGFDYSRPASYEAMTEKPPETAEADIYKHPRAQGSMGVDTTYKKTYDIYSLGIVLIEIAYWKSIDKLLGIPNVNDARPSVTIKIRSRLLDPSSPEKIIDGISDALGPVYRDVVQACIEGPEAFGLEPGANEVNSPNAATLQAGFYRKIIRKLNLVVNDH